MHKIGLPLKFHTDGYECEISENLAIYVRVKINEPVRMHIIIVMIAETVLACR